MNYLKYDIHWYNKIKHPDFDKLFPNNPVTGSKFVSPYHQWDISVKLFDTRVLIDIDGSIHDPNKISHDVTYFDGRKISLSDLITFNDSQRVYQTDNLNAYVIQCYDDKLTDNTPVVKINTGEIINFKSLIGILTFESMTEREKRKMFKSLEIV